MVAIRVRVNGVQYEHDVEPRLLLAHYLRDYIGLRSVRIGCDTTNCGACTVLLDGKAVKSCTVFAFMANNAEVVTLEGISEGGLHPLQMAFAEEHGLQCGYCTSGMVMTLYYYLNKARRVPSEDEVRRAIEGNLCRCTGYVGIVRAALKAARQMYG